MPNAASSREMTHDAVEGLGRGMRAYSLTHLRNVKIIRRRGVFVGVGGELRKFNFYRHILTHKHTHTHIKVGV